MTTKCIAILGAGPGLGLALARRYGKDGYAVALVGRRVEVLQAQSRQLGAEGVTAQGFQADLREPAQVSAVLADILSRFGRIDVLYYGPNAPEAFVPASLLSVDDVKDKVELFLYGLVASCLLQNGAQPARFRLAGLPDAYLDAGALPTLHERYGISTEALTRRIRAWMR